MKEQVVCSYVVVDAESPAFGNIAERVYDIACYLIESFINKIRGHKTYRDAMHTQ